MRPVLSQYPIDAILEIFGSRQLGLFLNMADKDSFVSESVMLMAGFKCYVSTCSKTACSLYHSSCPAEPYPPMPLVHLSSRKPCSIVCWNPRRPASASCHRVWVVFLRIRRAGSGSKRQRRRGRVDAPRICQDGFEHKWQDAADEGGGRTRRSPAKALESVR